LSNIAKSSHGLPITTFAPLLLNHKIGKEKKKQKQNTPACG
jgi:hypothetical protein